jgi:hypothetical protein
MKNMQAFGTGLERRNEDIIRDSSASPFRWILFTFPAMNIPPLMLMIGVLWGRSHGKAGVSTTS